MIATVVRSISGAAGTAVVCVGHGSVSFNGLVLSKPLLLLTPLSYLNTTVSEDVPCGRCETSGRKRGRVPLILFRSH